MAVGEINKSVHATVCADDGPRGAGPCFWLGMGTLSEYTVLFTDCSVRRWVMLCLNGLNVWPFLE